MSEKRGLLFFSDNIYPAHWTLHTVPWWEKYLWNLRCHLLARKYSRWHKSCSPTEWDSGLVFARLAHTLGLHCPPEAQLSLPRLSVLSQNTSTEHTWEHDQDCFWWCLKLDTLQKCRRIGIRSCGWFFKSVNIFPAQYCSRNFLRWNYSLPSFYHRRVTSPMLCHPTKSHESPVWVQNTRLGISQTHNTCDKRS